MTHRPLRLDKDSSRPSSVDRPTDPSAFVTNKCVCALDVDVQVVLAPTLRGVATQCTLTLENPIPLEVPFHWRVEELDDNGDDDYDQDVVEHDSNGEGKASASVSASVPSKVRPVDIVVTPASG